MTNPDARALLADQPVVPVVTLDDSSRAAALGDALVAGGVGVIEVTLRTPAAWDAIAALAERDDIIVGAGTVTTEAQVVDAAAHGARFVVSPGLDPAVVERGRAAGVTVLPGIATPSELQQALRLGLTAVKVFPAAQLGGVAFLDALAAPFPDVAFMPSGGVNIDTLGVYLERPWVFAAGCGWITPRDAVAAGDWDRITTLAREATAHRTPRSNTATMD